MHIIELENYLDLPRSSTKISTLKLAIDGLTEFTGVMVTSDGDIINVKHDDVCMIIDPPHDKRTQCGIYRHLLPIEYDSVSPETQDKQQEIVFARSLRDVILNTLPSEILAQTDCLTTKRLSIGRDTIVLTQNNSGKSVGAYYYTRKATDIFDGKVVSGVFNEDGQAIHDVYMEEGNDGHRYLDIAGKDYIELEADGQIKVYNNSNTKGHDVYLPPDRMIAVDTSKSIDRFYRGLQAGDLDIDLLKKIAGFEIKTSKEVITNKLTKTTSHGQTTGNFLTRLRVNNDIHDSAFMLLDDGNLAVAFGAEDRKYGNQSDYTGGGGIGWDWHLQSAVLNLKTGEVLSSNKTDSLTVRHPTDSSRDIWQGRKKLSMNYDGNKFVITNGLQKAVMEYVRGTAVEPYQPAEAVFKIPTVEVKKYKALREKIEKAFLPSTHEQMLEKANNYLLGLDSMFNKNCSAISENAKHKQSNSPKPNQHGLDM